MERAELGLNGSVTAFPIASRLASASAATLCGMTAAIASRACVAA
jgi:hypothetical protein